LASSFQSMQSIGIGRYVGPSAIPIKFPASTWNWKSW